MNGVIPETEFCPSCSRDVALDHGECPLCHRVLSTHTVDTSRSFFLTERGSYAPVGQTLPFGTNSVSSSSATPISSLPVLRRLESQRLRVRTGRHRALQRLRQLCSMLGLGTSNLRLMQSKLDLIVQVQYGRRKWVENVVCPVIVFHTARETGVPVTYDEMSRLLGASPFRFERNVREVCQAASLSVPRLRGMNADLLRRIAEKASSHHMDRRQIDEVVRLARIFAEVAGEEHLGDGRSPISIGAASVLLATRVMFSRVVCGNGGADIGTDTDALVVGEKREQMHQQQRQQQQQRFYHRPSVPSAAFYPPTPIATVKIEEGLDDVDATSAPSTSTSVLDEENENEDMEEEEEEKKPIILGLPPLPLPLPQQQQIGQQSNSNSNSSNRRRFLPFEMVTFDRVADAAQIAASTVKARYCEMLEVFGRFVHADAILREDDDEEDIEMIATPTDDVVSSSTTPSSSSSSEETDDEVAAMWSARTRRLRQRRRRHRYHHGHHHRMMSSGDAAAASAASAERKKQKLKKLKRSIIERLPNGRISPALLMVLEDLPWWRRLYYSRSAAPKSMLVSPPPGSAVTSTTTTTTMTASGSSSSRNERSPSPTLSESTEDGEIDVIYISDDEDILPRALHTPSNSASPRRRRRSRLRSTDDDDDDACDPTCRKRPRRSKISFPSDDDTIPPLKRRKLVHLCPPAIGGEVALRKYRSDKLTRARRRIYCRLLPRARLSAKESVIELDREDLLLEKLIFSVAGLRPEEHQKFYSEYVWNGRVEFPQSESGATSFSEDLCEEDCPDEELYRDHILTEEELVLRNKYS